MRTKVLNRKKAVSILIFLLVLSVALYGIYRHYNKKAQRYGELTYVMLTQPKASIQVNLLNGKVSYTGLKELTITQAQIQRIRDSFMKANFLDLPRNYYLTEEDSARISLQVYTEGGGSRAVFYNEDSPELPGEVKRIKTTILDVTGINLEDF